MTKNELTFTHVVGAVAGVLVIDHWISAPGTSIFDKLFRGGQKGRHLTGVIHSHHAMQKCPSNLFDSNNRCRQLSQKLVGGKVQPGDPSALPNSNFDDKGGKMCPCWANVDVFGNIQDHNTCYHSKDDANNKTNGFPGHVLDYQGGDYFTAVPCPTGVTATPTPTASPTPPPSSTPTKTGFFLAQNRW